MDHNKKVHPGTKIIIVDDSAPTLEVIQRNLEAAGYEVFTAQSVERAIAFLGKKLGGPGHHRYKNAQSQRLGVT